MNTQVPKVLYVIEMIEYERGWGSKLDGYLAFPNEEAGKSYIAEQTKDRVGPAPDYYVNYEVVGYKPASNAKIAEVLKAGRTYVDKLSELLKE